MVGPRGPAISKPQLMVENQISGLQDGGIKAEIEEIQLEFKRVVFKIVE